MTAYLRLRSLVGPPIGQALVADALQQSGRALFIIESDFLPTAINLHALFAMVIAEVKFRCVAVQMLLADVVINAVDAALEYREKSFNRVRVHVPAHVLLRCVVDNVMRNGHRADDAVLASVIRHQERLVGEVLDLLEI